MSLLTALEEKKYEDQMERAKKTRSWESRENICKARLIKQVQRAQERPNDYIDGLIVAVGSRGSEHVTFDEAFSGDNDKYLEYDTPEVRRSLYSIFRALTEIPKTWAKSATIRFLRGTGKQKGLKYHAAGTFGADYGWKTSEVDRIISLIVAQEYYRHGAGYSSVIVNYRDMYDEINAAANEDDDIDYNVRNFATQVERDNEFLNTCCKLLEERGLGPVPIPKTKKPKKARKKKEFKSGDLIRRKDLRDLPLPAHVSFPIVKEYKGKKQRFDDTLQQVVIGLTNDGHYQCWTVDPKTNKAHIVDYYSTYGNKNHLEGATYLGPWTKGVEKAKMDLGFSWWRKK